jgi:hypothetical protein
MLSLPITHYLPILSTTLCLIFAYRVYQRYLERGKTGEHLLWWTIGILTYGAGTFTESYITLFGWGPVVFKTWYIVGALLGGAPLAQGTVWLMLKDKTARILTYALVVAVIIPSIFIIMSPINAALVNPNLPSGKVFVWQWVRMFSPFINTYAVIFLIGGAIVSASRFYKASKGESRGSSLARDRFIGNSLIAIGAIMPAIGGTYTRMGITPALYVGEFFGIITIWLGYHYNIRKRPIVDGKPVVA